MPTTTEHDSRGRITADDDLAFAGLTRLSELLSRGQVTPRELTEFYLQRIERLDPIVGAFISVRAERALTEADGAHERLRAGDRGPLLGIPIAVKDNVDLVDEVTTHGNGGPHEPAPADSEVVRRLRAAGAIVLGKTALCELAGWGHFTSTEAFGITRNPWNLDRSPGGSSGGSAVAVAAGRDDALASRYGLEDRSRRMAAVGRRLGGRALRSSIEREPLLAARLNHVFDEHDLVLTPTTAAPPPPAEISQGAGAFRSFNHGSPYVCYTPTWNYVGQPAASIPAGFDQDGLPTAVQLAGPPNSDTTIVSLAAQLEAARPWHGQRPELITNQETGAGDR